MTGKWLTLNVKALSQLACVDLPQWTALHHERLHVCGRPAVLGGPLYQIPPGSPPLGTSKKKSHPHLLLREMCFDLMYAVERNTVDTNFVKKGGGEEKEKKHFFCVRLTQHLAKSSHSIFNRRPTVDYRSFIIMNTLLFRLCTEFKKLLVVMIQHWLSFTR